MPDRKGSICRWVVSVGGRDRAVCQWRVDGRAKEARAVPAGAAALPVLAPPPHHMVELTTVEYTAAGDAAAAPVEGTLEAPARRAAVETIPLSLTITTSDLKCVLPASSGLPAVGPQDSWQLPADC